MPVSEHEPQGTEAPSIFENDYDKKFSLIIGNLDT